MTVSKMKITLDDMRTWFGGDIKYSFIFMFGGSLMSVLVFGCLIILCSTTPVEAFNSENINGQNENMFLHIFFCLIVKKLYNHFTTYNTILNFHRSHGLITGPRTEIVIKFCNLQLLVLQRTGILRMRQNYLLLITIINAAVYVVREYILSQT